MRRSLAVSPSIIRPAGMPVQLETTAAMSSAPTSSFSMAPCVCRTASSCSAPASSRSSAGIRP